MDKHMVYAVGGRNIEELSHDELLEAYRALYQCWQDDRRLLVRDREFAFDMVRARP